MNGRIYDPTLGRFLQADPFIQAPKNSQNYNRYSYVLNNPMSYTDPSGYFFASLFKGVRKFVKKYWRTALAIGIAAVTGYGVNLFVALEAYSGAAIIAATGGALAGYVATGSLKGATVGALSSLAFFGIGQAFGASSGFFQSGGAGHMGAHALTGGIISDLQGGNFGHGFWSAGITKGTQVSGAMPDDLIGGVISSAVVGGTVSSLTGGKFANGATTAAFQFAMNAYVNRESRVQKAVDAAKLSKKYYKRFHKLLKALGSMQENILKTESHKEMLSKLPYDDLIELSSTQMYGGSKSLAGWAGGDRELIEHMMHEYYRRPIYRQQIALAGQAATAAQKALYISPFISSVVGSTPAWFQKAYSYYSDMNFAKETILGN